MKTQFKIQTRGSNKTWSVRYHVYIWEGNKTHHIRSEWNKSYDSKEGAEKWARMSVKQWLKNKGQDLKDVVEVD